MNNQFIKVEQGISIRLADKGDLIRLKEIWKLCFGDEDSFIDLYFSSRNWIEETAVVLINGTIASMLAMIPADFFDKTGKKHSAAMIYGVATHPDFQKMGLADTLLNASSEYLLKRQVGLTFLVPAGEDLFRYYGKRGYKEGFSIRQATLSRNEIKHLAAPAPCRLCLQPVEPQTYDSIRSSILKGHSYIDYRTEDIAFQKQLSRFNELDIYVIRCQKTEMRESVQNSIFHHASGQTEGCTVMERSSDTVFVKELLISDQYLVPVLMHIAELMPAEKYIVRMPAYSGQMLGGTVQHFGMIRESDSGAAAIEDFGAYLGIAFD